MHEYALCQEQIGEIATLARAGSESAVTDLHVMVGPLSAVERPPMQSAFAIAAAGTIADGARLHLREAPIEVSCGTCGDHLLRRIAAQSDQQEAGNV